MIRDLVVVFIILLILLIIISAIGGSIRHIPPAAGITRPGAFGVSPPSYHRHLHVQQQRSDPDRKGQQPQQERDTETFRVPAEGEAELEGVPQAKTGAVPVVGMDQQIETFMTNQKKDKGRDRMMMTKKMESGRAQELDGVEAFEGFIPSRGRAFGSGVWGMGTPEDIDHGDAGQKDNSSDFEKQKDMMYVSASAASPSAGSKRAALGPKALSVFENFREEDGAVTVDDQKKDGDGSFPSPASPDAMGALATIPE